MEEGFVNAPKAAPMQPAKKGRTGLIVGLVVAMLLVAGGTAAYMMGLVKIPLRQLPADEVIDKMLVNVTEIRGAKYGFNLEFKSEPRDVGAVSFDEAYPELKELQEALKRDSERLRDIARLQSALDRYFRENKVYPGDLAGLEESYTVFSYYDDEKEEAKDPKTEVFYGYRQEAGGQNYVLHVELETDQAVKSYNDAYEALLERMEEYPESYEYLKNDNGEIGEIKLTGKLVEVNKDTPTLYASSYLNYYSLLPFYANRDSYQYLPVEIVAKLGLSGRSETKEEGTHAEYSLDGSLDLGGTSFTAGADFMKKAKEYYLKVRQAPSFGFFDLAAIKNKWVKIVPEESTDYFFGDIVDEAEQEEYKDKVVHYLRLALESFRSNQVIQVEQELPMQEVGDEKMYRYEVRFDREKMAMVWKDIYAELSQDEGIDEDVRGDWEDVHEYIMEYLEGEELKKLDEYMRDNATLELWVDAAEFWPRKLSVNSRFVPPSDIPKLTNTQYRTIWEVSLDDVNKPFVVTAPADFISTDEAQNLIFGADSPLKNARQDEGNARIKSDLSELRVLAETYYDTHGKYYDDNGLPSYAGFAECLNDPNDVRCGRTIEEDVQKLMNGVDDIYGSKSIRVNAVGDHFCMSHPLMEANNYVCVDASGQFKEGAAVNCTAEAVCTE